MKIKKEKKANRMRGKGMGGQGHGFRKKAKGSGHRGGKGMSGSGKRADHKKTLVQKLYGHSYFGKQGITSRGTRRDNRDRLNIRDIELNLDKYATKTAKGFEINLKDYKILGSGEIKTKMFITAKEASKTAIEKVRKAGGEIILPKIKTKEESEKSEKDGSKEI